MKVLFAGLKYDYGLVNRGESLESKTFVPALRTNSSEFEVFWFEDNGFPLDKEKLQINLLQFAKGFNPEVIFFVLMKDEISFSTLEELGKRHTTVNWFCDDTWRFDDFSRQVAPKFTALITNDKYSLSKYRSIGCENVILSQWGALAYDADLDLEKINYIYDISFVGGKNPTREWMINELKKVNLNVHCFGEGWENGRVSFDQMKSIFYTSKINLNLSNSVPSQINFFKFILKKLLSSIFNLFKGKSLKEYVKGIVVCLRYIKFYFSGKKTSEQVKARNFEISGWGGFQLSQYALELEDYYRIGEEIAVFTSNEELIKQCEFYLNNNELRQSVCKNGHVRTSEHNYDTRMKNILSYLKNIQV